MFRRSAQEAIQHPNDLACNRGQATPSPFFFGTPRIRWAAYGSARSFFFFFSCITFGAPVKREGLESFRRLRPRGLLFVDAGPVTALELFGVVRCYKLLQLLTSGILFLGPAPGGPPPAAGVSVFAFRAATPRSSNRLVRRTLAATASGDRSRVLPLGARARTDHGTRGMPPDRSQRNTLRCYIRIRYRDAHRVAAEWQVVGARVQGHKLDAAWTTRDQCQSPLGGYRRRFRAGTDDEEVTAGVHEQRNAWGLN